MRFGIQCYDCIVKQFVNLIDKENLDENRKHEILSELIAMILKSDKSYAAPIVVKKIYARLYQAIGDDDPFKEIKRKSNDFALNLADSIKEILSKSNDRILDGLRLSIAGNIMDYAAPGGKGLHEIENFIGEALKYDFDEKTIEQFKDDIENSNKILFIGDNAGEIVFDMLFIEELPAEKITYCVRGAPIINDITMEDAVYIGLDKIVKVISTGDSTPGIDLRYVSSEFKKNFYESDMIILKGQGNVETLFYRDISEYTEKKIPLYFLFKVKCEHVSREVNKKYGSIEIIRKV